MMRMRTLVVSPIVPYPLNTGANQRLFHTVRALSRVGDVTLVAPAPSATDAAQLDPLRQLLAGLETFSRQSYAFQRDLALPRTVGRIKAWLRHAHPWNPVLLQWTATAEGRALVARLAEGFDVVWAFRLSSLRLLPARVRGRVVVDLDDLEHRKLGHRLAERRFGRMAALDLLEYGRLRAVERALPRLPHDFVVCSADDRRVLGNGENVHVIPNGVDVPPARVRRPRARPTFVFVGYMAYEPNVDAVTLFVSTILQPLRRALPDARFVIVGRDPVPAVRRLHDGDTVIVTGTVPSVAPHLQEATALVVPLRFGGGTRIKILEAMAHGTPVVSTPVGVEGLHVQDGRDLLVASVDEFVTACRRLHDDPALAARLSENGTALVAKHYDWTLIEQQIQRLVARGRHAQTAVTELIEELS
jgi:glycosyltransferase involved in cell wall biosynthesis